MFFFVLLIASTVIAAEGPRLAERLLAPPDRSHSFSSKSFFTSVYSYQSLSSVTTPSPPLLFKKNFPKKSFSLKAFFKKKKKSNAKELAFLKKKAWLPTSVAEKNIFSSSRKMKTIEATAQLFSEKLSSSSSLNTITGKMNKKLSLEEIYQLLNRPQ